MAKQDIEIIVGGKAYIAKATLGLYARAGEATGFDISEIFNAVMPPRKFYVALAAEVCGISVEELENEMLMCEYTDLCTAIVRGVLPDTIADDGLKNPMTPGALTP